jgi:hypothetical protein
MLLVTAGYVLVCLQPPAQDVTVIVLVVSVVVTCPDLVVVTGQTVVVVYVTTVSVVLGMEWE